MRHRMSVLMSVYHKENPAYLREAMESLLAQTRPADEYVVVEDGPLTAELYAVLDDYQARLGECLKRVPLAENRGLGLALREGVLHCTGDLIARMDSDDLSLPERFEKQEACFLENEALDIVGTYIDEFELDPMVISGRREVPLDQAGILRYQKMRSALNHVTVLFKKDTCLRAGNYEDAPYMEDDMLWFNFISAGAQMKNLPESLVLVRVGAGMIERRGGGAYLQHYKKARRTAWKRGQINALHYYSSLWIQFLVAHMGSGLRRLVFFKLLRQQKGKEA